MYKSTYPKRFSVKTNKLVIGFLLLIFCGTVSAQRVNVVDHRGTKGTTGNTVTIAAAAPTDPAPIQGDVWYDTSDANNTITKLFDGTSWRPINIATTSLFDDDVNTGIQVEESTDENKIRFDTSGTERMLIDDDGNVGLGTDDPVLKLDLRGSSDGIGAIGVGKTELDAPVARAGALRYTENSGGVMQYSNGIVWNDFVSSVVKSVVIASKTTPQQIENNNGAVIVDWLEETDNNNTFDAATGVFTAPRDGNYIISFSFNFVSSNIRSGGQAEAILAYEDGSSKPVKKSVVSFNGAGFAEAGASITFGFSLEAGEQIRPIVWNALQNAATPEPTNTLRVGASASDGSSGFVNFSVFEL